MPSDEEPKAFQESELNSHAFSAKDKQIEEIKHAGNEDEAWILNREGSRAVCKTGEVMYQCRFCQKQGKPMYFGTEHDLNLHINAWHTGQPNPDYAR